MLLSFFRGGNLSHLSAGIVFPVPEVKYLANLSVLEPALKVEPVSTVSVLAASLLTEVSIIPAFGGLVWYDAVSDWGFSKDFRGRAGISIGRHPIG